MYRPSGLSSLNPPEGREADVAYSFWASHLRPVITPLPDTSLLTMRSYLFIGEMLNPDPGTSIEKSHPMETKGDKMVFFNACPKCHGDLQLAEDQPEAYVRCKRCGFVRDAAAHQLIAQKEAKRTAV